MCQMVGATLEDNAGKPDMLSRITSSERDLEDYRSAKSCHPDRRSGAVLGIEERDAGADIFPTVEAKLRSFEGPPVAG